MLPRLVAGVGDSSQSQIDAVQHRGALVARCGATSTRDRQRHEGTGRRHQPHVWWWARCERNGKREAGQGVDELVRVSNKAERESHRCRRLVQADISKGKGTASASLLVDQQSSMTTSSRSLVLRPQTQSVEVILEE